MTPKWKKNIIDRCIEMEEPIVEEPIVEEPVVEEPVVEEPVVEEPVVEAFAAEEFVAIEPVQTNVVNLSIPIVKTIEILRFNVNVINVQLFSSARIAVIIECSDNGRNYQEYRELVLAGDDYSAWANDDSYVVNYVKDRINTLI